MFHTQSTYLRYDSSSKSTVFCYSPLSVRLDEFYIFVGICSGKNFALYTFDSNYPDASLNRHYLTKKSGGPDKRGLSCNCFSVIIVYGPK